jgi:hypothetical protein
MARNQAQKKPVMPVCPIHHRGDAKCKIRLHASLSAILPLSSSLSRYLCWPPTQPEKRLPRSISGLSMKAQPTVKTIAEWIIFFENEHQDD